MSNYLIRATYYSDHDEKDVTCEGVVVAGSYAQAIEIFVHDLGCPIIDLTVRELVLSNRIVWLEPYEYDRMLYADTHMGEDEDVPF